MNKTAIKNFSIWARNKLIADISYRAGLMGITSEGIKDALPQSTKETQFFDIGTKEPYAISGKQITQRQRLVELLRQKTADSDYKTAYQYVIEEVAYTWFNRLIAIRFMEVNDYLPAHIRVLSSESGKQEPDLVTKPMDAELDFSAEEVEAIRQYQLDNKLDELFRFLFIKQCNTLHPALPQLFELTDDYTELLLSLSYIDRDGVVYHLVNDIPEADFNIEQGGQVEIIGWLYQYYNTEPKDQVFANLKKNIKISKDAIPAATQLFTPDWIVRYMVENSLGRLWVEGHPNDELKAGWKYYLEEAEQESEVEAQLAEIRKEHAALAPEDIKFIDPCMGSGHILVYAFDVLMQIYRSCGWSDRDAAASIVEHNLHGLDIDRRAAQLAYFAVMMKARQYDRRALTRGLRPKVFAIAESNHVNPDYLKLFGDLEPQAKCLLDNMRDAKEYGSILKMELSSFELATLRQAFETIRGAEYDNFFDSARQNGLVNEFGPLLDTAEMLGQQYEAVVTNPPYMGASGMGTKLAEFVKREYPDSKSDLFAVFIERCAQITKRNSYQAMITQHAWMFLSSFEKLRTKLRVVDTVNMVHLGPRAFEEIGGEVVQTTSFVMRRSHVADYKGTYCRLIKPTTQQGKEDMFLTSQSRYTAQQSSFSQIPGSPVVYWVSNAVYKAFSSHTISDYCPPKAGLSTGDNERFLRLFWEVNFDHIFFDGKKRDDLKNLPYLKKWIPHPKGGLFRRWYGNNDYVLNFGNDGEELKYWLEHNPNDPKTKSYSRYIRNYEQYLKPGFSFNDVSSGKTSFRFQKNGFIPNARGPFFYSEDYDLLGYLNSKVCLYFLNIIAPTLTYNVGDVQRIPYQIRTLDGVKELTKECIELSEEDWNSYETSWDFKEHPLVTSARRASRSNEWITVQETYEVWQGVAEERFQKLKANEEELNRIFIDIYGLQDELTPEVEDKDVTVRRADEHRDIKSLISYAVGCMFGRYNLGIDGLAFAGGAWDASKYTTFHPDEDNIIPITDAEYLGDDIVTRFCEFIRTVYGEKSLESNLDYIASVLGNKGDTSREVIRNYFLNDFFKDHCQTYSVAGSGKRPIYWLFDSGKQNGFKALIYLHRYTPDTIGNVRVDYLHKLQRIYENEINRMQDMMDNSKNAREVSASSKRKEKLQKQLKECREYDEKLAHLALSRIELDLDDGVKVNYRKMQTAQDGKFYEVLADSKNIMAKEK